MKTSESIKTIAPLLLKAQMTMGDAKKGMKNDFYKSSYADLNSIREVSIPVLNDLGIAVLQPTVVEYGKNYVETILIHAESGEWVSSQTAIVNDKGTAQAEGSGLSYARRYGLQALLNIGAVDDDAEGATKRGPVSKNTLERKLTNAALRVDPKSNEVDASSLVPIKKSTFRKAASNTMTAPLTDEVSVDEEESDDWV